jgi:hypothetical protein
VELISVCSALPAKDGSNKLKFYYIDLVQAMIRSAEDPTLQGKPYHTFKFEMEVDQEGNRGFEANSGLVFESFYLLDDQSAPLIGIVASDASHQGNMIHRPLYCKFQANMQYLSQHYILQPIITSNKAWSQSKELAALAQFKISVRNFVAREPFSILYLHNQLSATIHQLLLQKDHALLQTSILRTVTLKF